MLTAIYHAAPAGGEVGLLGRSESGSDRIDLARSLCRTRSPTGPKGIGCSENECRLNYDRLALHVRGMQTYEVNAVFDPAFKRTQINNHYSVLVVFYNLCQCRHQLDLSFVGQIAPEYRIMNGISKAFHCLVDGVQTLWVHDIVADNIAFHFAHINRPLIWSRKVDIPESHRR
jgi:hypothetical protein